MESKEKKKVLAECQPDSKPNNNPPVFSSHQIYQEKPASGNQPKLVVIGNGMVSFRFLERLTSGAPKSQYQITVFGGESHPAYDRVTLTDFFRNKPPEKLQLANKDWYRERHIELFTGDPVTSIDTEKKSVSTRSGIIRAYDRLVIATGSAPIIPPILGCNLPRVFVYRTLEDVKAIRDQAKFSHRAAVIGGGLLGLEAADALKELGLRTHIIERSVSLMSRQLPIPGAKVLETQLKNRGFLVHLNQHTQSIREQGQNLIIEFRNDQALLVDMVVIASGVRPTDGLARKTGLSISKRGGIEVNDSLETSLPTIAAIGDCASHRGISYGLVGPGYAMADTLAARLNGQPDQFSGSPFSTQLKLIGVSVSTLGDFNGQGEHLEFASKEVFRQLLIRDGRLVGATIVGDYNEINRLKQAIDRRQRIWQWEKVRFRYSGNIWATHQELAVSLWPPNAIVCNCLRVNRACLSQHLQNQTASTVEDLTRITGASSVCGSCKPLLANLVGTPITTLPVKGYRGLAIASVVSVIAALVILLLPPIPNSTSVITPSIDFLWTDSFSRFVSGYSLAALFALSLLLSLRKRIKRIQFGNFGYWRALHASLGVLCLFVLITHTGLRLGENLNFLLMVNFLALAVAGALAGFVNSLEARLSYPLIKRLRGFSTLLHIVLFWPLPVLVFFHAFKAYYY